MSFLADPPLLVGSGAVIETVIPDEDTRRRVEMAVVVIFLVTSISLYFDLPWTKWLWKLCRAKSGRDWMLNSGLLRMDYEHVGARTHALSAGLFALYPLWIRLGRRIGAEMLDAA
jgi:hypothetical protein